MIYEIFNNNIVNIVEESKSTKASIIVQGSPKPEQLDKLKCLGINVLKIHGVLGLENQDIKIDFSRSLERVNDE